MEVPELRCRISESRPSEARHLSGSDEQPEGPPLLPRGFNAHIVRVMEVEVLFSFATGRSGALHKTGVLHLAGLWILLSKSN